MASIRSRPRASGPRWSVRYRLDGEPREKTFKRRSDAEAFKRRIEADEVAGLVIDPRAGEQAFGPYAEAWVESRRVKGKPLSPTTVAGYKSLLRRFLIPAFGRTPLRKITPDVVRNWYAELAKTSGQDPAAKSYRLLRAVLNTAVSDDILARNPCRIRGGGIEHSAERPMLDATTVLTVADAVDPRYRALVLLAGFGGLRTGEMLGLSRRDGDGSHAGHHHQGADGPYRSRLAARRAHLPARHRRARPHHRRVPRRRDRQRADGAANGEGHTDPFSAAGQMWASRISATRLQVQKCPLSRSFVKRRRPESNRCTGLCRPLPKPLGHAAGTAHDSRATLLRRLPSLAR